MNIIKLKLYKIKVDKDIDIIYDRQSKTFMDKNSRKILHRIKISECKSYYFFELLFDSYNYISYYNAENSNYRKELVSKNYIFYIYLNLKNIKHKNYMNSISHKDIAHCLKSISINELKSKIDYNIPPDKVKKIINFRENNKMYFISWKYFRLNNKFVYDMENENLLNFRRVKKKYFNYKGGIIETNNVPKIIEKIANTKNILVILPTNLKHLWSKHTVVAYEELNSVALKYKKWDKIIIHECYIDLLPLVKDFLKNIEYDTCWIINSLPLNIYFSKSENLALKLNLSQIFTLSNFWIRLGNKNLKKIYKFDLIKMFLTKFNQYYFIINYRCDDIINKTIKLNDYETNIRETVNNQFKIWKDNLHVDSNNIYSLVDKEKIKKIKNDIFTSNLLLFSSAINIENSKSFFHDKIYEHINFLEMEDKNLYRTQKKYQKTHILNNINLVRILNSIDEKKKVIKNKLQTFNKYATNNYKQTWDACPICYDDSAYYIKLICTHSFCVNCIFKILTNKNECPLCRENMTISKMSIIVDSYDKYQSEYLFFLLSLKDTDVLLADSNILGNKNLSNINLFYIKDLNILSLIKINVILNIYILTDYKVSENNKLVNIINYFRLLQNPPNICKVKFI